MALVIVDHSDSRTPDFRLPLPIVSTSLSVKNGIVPFHEGVVIRKAHWHTSPVEVVSLFEIRYDSGVLHWPRLLGLSDPPDPEMVLRILTA
jgi:hypothetical protein